MVKPVQPRMAAPQFCDKLRASPRLRHGLARKGEQVEVQRHSLGGQVGPSPPGAARSLLLSGSAIPSKAALLPVSQAWIPMDADRIVTAKTLLRHLPIVFGREEGSIYQGILLCRDVAPRSLGAQPSLAAIPTSRQFCAMLAKGSRATMPARPGVFGGASQAEIGDRAISH